MYPQVGGPSAHPASDARLERRLSFLIFENAI